MKESRDLARHRDRATIDLIGKHQTTTRKVMLGDHHLLSFILPWAHSYMSWTWCSFGQTVDEVCPNEPDFISLAQVEDFPIEPEIDQTIFVHEAFLNHRKSEQFKELYFNALLSDPESGSHTRELPLAMMGYRDAVLFVEQSISARDQFELEREVFETRWDELPLNRQYEYASNFALENPKPTYNDGSNC